VANPRRHPGAASPASRGGAIIAPPPHPTPHAANDNGSAFGRRIYLFATLTLAGLLFVATLWRAFF